MQNLSWYQGWLDKTALHINLAYFKGNVQKDMNNGLFVFYNIRFELILIWNINPVID